MQNRLAKQYATEEKSSTIHRHIYPNSRDSASALFLTWNAEATVELEKTLKIINILGLDILIEKRG